jgi:hypothetical protein
LVRSSRVASKRATNFYPLSPFANDNVKIRNLLMDIKALQQVNPDGLEQWKPVMKATFPYLPPK